MNHGNTSAPEDWRPPEAEVQALIRQGADLMLRRPQDWMDKLDDAGFIPGSQVSFDPVLIAATKRANLASTIHWAEANLDHPGMRVPALVSVDMLNSAREFVRRGEISVMFRAMHWIQSAAWQLWMGIAFTLTTDPALLKGLLDASARSIFAFNDDIADELARFVKEEQERRGPGARAERLAMVSRILEGENVRAPLAGHRLGYALEQTHLAAIFWSEEAAIDGHTLDLCATLLARSAGSRDLLTVIVNPATAWVWVAAPAQLDLGDFARQLGAHPAVRLAIGPARPGVGGFRSSHRGAIAVQRLVARLKSPRQISHYDDARLVAVMSQDPESLDAFVSDTLGKLATASPVLRRSLLIYLRAGCNVTHCAELLHTHRNTVLRRLDQAAQLLPQPLESTRTAVAAALEVMAWIRGI